MKTMQMPTSFFNDVYKLLVHLEDYRTELDPQTLALCDSLARDLNAKIAAQERRQTFTKYKTAEAGSDEREAFRNEYLDQAGVHRNWRTTTEQREDTPL